MKFDGADYNHERDSERLTSQLSKIMDVVKDGNWRTLKEIADITLYPEASISAQLRHLRKERFGSHEVEKTYIKNGLYKYRVIINKGDKNA